MHKHRVLYVLVLVILSLMSCRGPEGPVGPAGPASLTDPSVMPQVIYTFPPPNSVGPYSDPYFGGGYSLDQLQIRFNKLMDRGTVRRALHVTAPGTSVFVDTSSVYSLGGDVYSFYVLDSTESYYHRWKLGATYTLQVDATATDVNGNRLQLPYSMTFFPEPTFRVRWVYPENDRRDVTATSSIYIYFNSDVDSSILSHLQLSPPLDGRWRLDTYYLPRVVYDYGFELLDLETMYTISVTAGAHDKDGNQIQQPFTSTFATAPFRVNYTYPRDKQTHFYLLSAISIFMTGPVDTGTVRSAFRISPNVIGDLYFYEQPRYSFSFSPYYAGFAGNTQYTVTIDTTLRSTRGDRMNAPYTFSFTTAAFQVISSSPSHGSTGVDTTTSIWIYCNGLIDSSTIRSAFSLRDSAGASVSGSFSSWDYDNFFYFYPSPYLRRNAVYTVEVTTALRSKSGSNLAVPYTAKFRTR